MDPVQILLVAILVLCCAYFTVPDAKEATDPPKKRSTRDLDWEHRLGAHAKDAVWGCRACQERK